MKLLLLCLSLALTLTTVQSISYANCTSGSTYFCPSVCGGIQVKDCAKECDGFLSSDEEHKICIDRRLFQKHNIDPEDHKDHYHYLWNDLVGALVWFITAGISIACGVGGGGIYVPLGILLFGFAPKQSSGLSQASIFGAGLAGLILNSRNRHPTEKIRQDPGMAQEGAALPIQQELSKEQEEQYVSKGGKFYTRPLIHFDMALFMAPMQMAGAVLGVLVQTILPNWLYLLSAGLVLSYTSYKTYVKYFSARKAELAKQRQEEETNKENDAKSQAESVSSDRSVEDGTKNVPAKELSEEAIQLRLQYLEHDMKQYPKEKIGALVLLWVGLFILTLMKGGKGVDSLVGIDCESPWYAVLIACQFTWLFAFAVYFGRKLMKDQQDRAQVDYPFLEDDPAWDVPNMRFYVVMCFMSGVVAGLIGVGGGMILGPLMLVAGVNSRVAAATNASMIVITSSSIALMFVTSGLIHYSYAMFYFVVCFGGAWLGKLKVDAFVKKSGRASVLIFLLASIIAFATVGCLVIMLTRLVEKDWCFEDFNEFCTVDGEENCPVDRFLNAISL